MRLDTSAVIKLLSISLVFYFKLLCCQHRCLKCPVVLTSGVLFLDWNFWPFLEIFKNFQKSLKVCKINDFTLFCKSCLKLQRPQIKKMFTSIFNTYHCAPILCCTTTDLGIFSTVVLFLEFLNLWEPICESWICESPDALQSIMVKCRQKTRSEKL